MVVLDSSSDGLVLCSVMLLLLLLQCRLDADLLPHSLLSQFAVQLVNAAVGVSD